LPARPKIPARFTVIPLENGEYRFHSYSFSLAVSCSSPNLMRRLLPLLDGSRRLGEVLQEMRVFGKEATTDLLSQMNEAGLLEDAAQLSSAVLSQDELRRYQNQLTFFSHFTAASQVSLPAGDYGIPKRALEYQEMLKQAQLVVFGLGRLGSALALKLALSGIGRIRAVDDEIVSPADVQQSGVYRPASLGEPRARALQGLAAELNPAVELIPTPQPDREQDSLRSLISGCSLAVLCTDEFNPLEYEQLNLACLAEDLPWTSCRMVGFELLIGPTVIPRQTPCFNCFDLRQKGNLTDYEEYTLLEGYLRTNPIHSGALPIAPGVDLAALEIIKALTHFMQPATYAHLYSLNLLTMESKRHPVLKLPRCPHCGRPAQPRPAIQLWQPVEAGDQANS
jgi:bacteriocin biosynthesis cyclodehydratase domain-containing protein